MRLKSIKLSGFKSFVDPTVINFPSNLGAVVGPNGCGKSNVIDAVRWVMGESSAKNLRGESMTDVIFNGSSARKPVGQASVELVFDNQDRKLTGEYVNYNEVAVRRKVDRDGNSVYSLNGTSCRRKDITDIFLGTGLGARSYSIIEQGMVSRLIESKPEELRIYIEEAAGISKYKERRKETERRIKRTKENLDRLSDIRDELERQLQHLKRQSVAAEKYGQLKQEERETTANLNAIRWSNLDRELKANQEKINKLQLSDLDLKKITNSESPEILIAGCGTGQHAITTASKYKKSKILALDLSFKSLSYAKRKANELKINNIDFIQGDILDLEYIDRKFDIIESVGVLHHMDNPFKGWKILTSCLNNDSLMLIGLYSEKAREHIAKIKNKINKLGLQSTYKNIIKFRKDLIENNYDLWNDVKSSPDFYTVSGVRDLLFHAQEHRFTISKIKENLSRLGLTFLGFEDKLVKEKYKKIYPNKIDLYDLNKWEKFEKSNPRIFAGMYQFWCKRN